MTELSPSQQDQFYLLRPLRKEKLLEASWKHCLNLKILWRKLYLQSRKTLQLEKTLQGVQVRLHHIGR